MLESPDINICYGIAVILSTGYLRLQAMKGGPLCSDSTPRNPPKDLHFALAIPVPQSNESEPGLNSPSPLNERGFDV